MVKEARAVMKRDLGLSADAWGEGEGGGKAPNKAHKVSPEGSKVTDGGSKVTPGGKGRRRSGSKVTPPTVRISPHLKYQLENCQPASLTQVVERKLVSLSLALLATQQP